MPDNPAQPAQQPGASSPMNVDEALTAFCAADVGPGDCQDALYVLGAHLAQSAELEPDVAVVVVGRAGLALLPGVTETAGRRRTFVATPGRHPARRRQVSISWLAGPPPANLPLALLDDLIARGDTITALLDDLADRGHHAAVTVLAVLAAPEGLATIQDRHPDVEVFLARLAEDVDDYGHLVPSTHGDTGDKLYGPGRP